MQNPVSIQTQSLALLALRALRLDGNRAKRKRLRWQAADHGCHCFDRASYWLLLADPNATHAIAFGWKPGFTLCDVQSVIRVVFHERRLQYMEREQLDVWRQTRPGERIVDMGLHCSTSLLLVLLNSSYFSLFSFCCFYFFLFICLLCLLIR